MNFFIYTFGCRLNQAESQELAQALTKKGLALGPDISSADLVIVNTCVVTTKAEKEVRQLIRKIKKENKKAKIAVCGCWVDKINQFGGLKPAGIDLVISNKEKWQKALEKIEKFLPEKNKKKPTGIKNHRLLLGVQNGCNNYCSYCLPALIRGEPKSMSITSVINKVNQAVNNGALELVLTGQNLAAYDDNGKDWLDLVEQILLKTKIKLIRFGSINPFLAENKEKSFKNARLSAQRLIKIYHTIGKTRLSYHLHLSLQSGSDKILKLMNRKYTAWEFLTMAQILKKNIKNLNLTTDIIVGFPGETEQDFSQTLDLAKKVGFGKIHIFRFSKRKGTLAAKMEKEWGRVGEEVKKTRANLLGQLERQLRYQFWQNQVGKTVRAIIWPDGRGLTDNYLPIIRIANGLPEETRIALVKLIAINADGWRVKQLD